MDDLSSLGTPQTHQYEIFAIKYDGGDLSLSRAQKPSDFVLKTENLGIAQRRHRVIIVGVRSDLASRVPSRKIMAPTYSQTVRSIIGNLPPLRSGISKGTDTDQEWMNHTQNAAAYLSKLASNLLTDDLRAAFSQLANNAGDRHPMGRSSTELPMGYGASKYPLLNWLENPELKAIAQHETRGHIKSDLDRYLYAACFGSVREFSPKARDFPKDLSPNHVNWESGIFNDRFRVQLADQPATTITSHISKDGHYFIHPDPRQCRSLTVREAARLQSFPDDYLFLGHRTSQYVQVGNAVPPYVALQIAKLIYEIVH
jgi:DNA (cytosine-5)-methyltransferase 1